VGVGGGASESITIEIDRISFDRGLCNLIPIKTSSSIAQSMLSPSRSRVSLRTPVLARFVSTQYSLVSL
jgi:hypothetical protein